MEFRLSDEKVTTADSYNEYRAIAYNTKYTSDGWMVLRDWLIDAGFDCSWSDAVISGHPIKPTKNSSTALWDAMVPEINKVRKYGRDEPVMMGGHAGTDNVTYSGVKGNDDGCAWSMTSHSDPCYMNDFPWGEGVWSTGMYGPVLFVRPL